MEVEVGEAVFRVSLSGRRLTIPFAAASDEAEDEADLVVNLDEIEHWDPPDEERLVELEELGKILEAIERECDKRRLVVAFE
jgi:hypothetical protein